MSQSGCNKYRVVLHQSFGVDDLGEMVESDLYGYVRTRLGGNMEAAEAVLRELDEKGRATVYFEPALGPRIRADIERVVAD